MPTGHAAQPAAESAALTDSTHRPLAAGLAEASRAAAAARPRQILASLPIYCCCLTADTYPLPCPPLDAPLFLPPLPAHPLPLALIS